MVSLIYGVLFTLLMITINLSQCLSQKYSDECPLDIFNTLHSSASTVQSYTAIKRNMSHDGFEKTDIKAEKIWMLIRHGTRRPKAKKIIEMKELAQFRDEIVANLQNAQHIPFCDSDWIRLKQWKWDENITDDQAQMLTQQGQEEIRSIAENYKKKFPELFDIPFDPTKFHFQYTEADRTRDSFYAFVDEIFGTNAHTQINAEPTEATQALLKPYKTCAAFVSQQESLKDDDSELNKFQDSKLFKRMMKEISQRLGFNERLKKKQIMNMFDMCRYEQAWNINTSSVWCTMFTPHEIKVLEYTKDLSGYYEFGYGFEMNRRIQCATVRDMNQHLESNDDPRVTVYFGHSSALLLHLTAMGAFEDEEKLTARGFLKKADQKWSTSKMSPFAGNLAAVRYSNNEVKFFLNEELIPFEWCNQGMCKMADVKEKYKDFKDCEKTHCPIERPKSIFDQIESFIRLLL